MSWKKRAILIAGFCAAVLCTAAQATQIGQEIADKVNAASYQHYLSDLLYTHDGNDRNAYGGADHDPARDNILATFQSLGLQVELQSVPQGNANYNVVATQVGTMYPDSYYVIGAHYDSVGTPGADDNASGVAGVLEIARILSTYNLDYTVKYMAFDMEEEGLYGSERYANSHLADDIRGMISLDMIAFDAGGQGCALKSQYTASLPFRLAVKTAILEYGNGIVPYFMAGTGGSDHWPFEVAGFPACMLIENNYTANPCYHYPCDSVETAGYINYDFACNMTRSIAGFLADHAVARRPGDCDGNGIPDLEEILANPALDCNNNGRLDACELHGSDDCNHNSVPDLCDISSGTSQDCNHNNVPDECEWLDCNSNGLLDQCDIAAGASQDCNHNGIPDKCDLASGTSQDCDNDGAPDECKYTQGGSISSQLPDGSGAAVAQNFSAEGYPQYSVKQWDDFTLAGPLRLGRGQAFFGPTDWGCFQTVPFLVEIAAAPGGAEAGAAVVATVTGAGTAVAGVIEWDFQGAILPAGTWWISVQAQGGLSCNIVNWERTNPDNPNGSQHYYHNPGGAWGYGTAAIPASLVYGAPADLAFILRDPFRGDCNHDGILDACDIAHGTSPDSNGNSVPDECEDLWPPQPDPMTFDAPAGLPIPISTTAISMRATEGSDSFGVEYYFSGSGAGSHSRTWSPDRSFTDTGLQVNRNYSYKAKTRDGSPWHNESAYTAPCSVATAIETPTALTFGSFSRTSMRITAPGTFTRLTSNLSGLFFEVTRLDGTPVGGAQANAWVKTQTITASGLTPGRTYRVRVKARNYYGVNETPWYPASGYVRQSIPAQTGPINFPNGSDVGGQEQPRK